mgnify:CR=1 FL=1
MLGNPVDGLVTSLLCLAFVLVSSAPLQPRPLGTFVKLAHLTLIFASAAGNAVPLNFTKWQGKTVMMISAHPDDIEACAGGTIRLLTAMVSVDNVITF